MKAPRAKRVTFTPHPKLLEMLEELTTYGLYGRTVAEVAERLVCRGIEQVVTIERVKLKP